MTQEQHFEDLAVADVPAKAAELKADGWRMVQICGLTETGYTELIYSFDRDHTLNNYRVKVPFGTPVKSITPTYWAAFVYENEVHDLFDVEFEDSKLDYKGTFFRTGKPHPWKGPEDAAGTADGKGAD